MGGRAGAGGAGAGGLEPAVLPGFTGAKTVKARSAYRIGNPNSLSCVARFKVQAWCRRSELYRIRSISGSGRRLPCKRPDHTPALNDFQTQ